MEGADEVLALGGVDAGLAADGRVDHAEHGGGDGDPAHSAQPGRGDEAGQVGGGAAADADDDVGAGEAGLAEGLPAVGGDLGGLGLLRVGQLDGDGLVALLGEVLADRLAGPGQRLGVQYGDPLGRGADQPGQFAEELAADQDLVGLGARGAADPDAGSRVCRSCSCVLQLECVEDGFGHVLGGAPSVATTALATSV